MIVQRLVIQKSHSQDFSFLGIELRSGCTAVLHGSVSQPTVGLQILIEETFLSFCPSLFKINLVNLKVPNIFQVPVNKSSSPGTGG